MQKTIEPAYTIPEIMELLPALTDNELELLKSVLAEDIERYDADDLATLQRYGLLKRALHGKQKQTMTVLGRIWHVVRNFWWKYIR